MDHVPARQVPVPETEAVWGRETACSQRSRARTAEGGIRSRSPQFQEKTHVELLVTNDTGLLGALEKMTTRPLAIRRSRSLPNIVCEARCKEHNTQYSIEADDTSLISRHTLAGHQSSHSSGFFEDHIPPPPWIPPPPKALYDMLARTTPDDPALPAEVLLSDIKVVPDAHSNGFDLGGASQHPNEPSFESKLGRLHRLRLQCLSWRQEVHDKRHKLRELQREKSTAEDKLIQRQSLLSFGLFDIDNVKNGEEKTLAQLSEDCQEARGLYGPVEDECNELEDRLGEKEVEMQRLEEHLYTRWGNTSTTQNQDTVSTAVENHSTAASTMADVEEMHEEHPLITAYLSKLGELDLLQERLADLENERSALEESKEAREKVERFLAPEDQAWLDNAPILADGLSEEIWSAEKDVEEKMRRCLEAGVIDDNGQPTDFSTQIHQSFRDEPDVKSDQLSEYLKHPTLLPKPGKRSQRGSSPVKDSDVENKKPPESLGVRVNRWIREHLQESALEVSLLVRTFENQTDGNYGEMDQGWEEKVLYYWDNDDTVFAKNDCPRTGSLTARLQVESKRSVSPGNYDSEIVDLKPHPHIRTTELYSPNDSGVWFG